MKYFQTCVLREKKAIYQLDLKGRGLIALEEPKTKICAAKKSNNLGQSSWWWNFSFNN